MTDTILSFSILKVVELRIETYTALPTPASDRFGELKDFYYGRPPAADAVDQAAFDHSSQVSSTTSN